VIDERLKGVGEIAGFQVRGVVADLLEACPYASGEPDVVVTVLTK